MEKSEIISRMILILDLLKCAKAHCSGIENEIGDFEFSKPVNISVKELERIKSFYEKEGSVVYNVGGRRKTLLPFKRKRPKEMISNGGRL